MMIARVKASADKEGLMLGLSRENVNRLIAGKPIVLTAESHHGGVPDGWEIFIFFGETEAEMVKQFKQAGVVGPETKTWIDPRLV